MATINVFIMTVVFVILPIASPTLANILGLFLVVYFMVFWRWGGGKWLGKGIMDKENYIGWDSTRRVGRWGEYRV